MQGERWRQLQDLYHTSVALQREDRVRFVREACG
jgi:hypothetical protein